ncbi:hypothetical protein [Ornithinibacillus sp. FSL M8-0202]|uniref:hypothetical protein n=1 Tax=Ornithinibacillus sp. FSL M8-0202 TaxID=2921616 RepID=UPI0030CE87D7
MDKHIDVMKQSLELQDTLMEGLKHIQIQINEGKYEDSILLFEEAVRAYSMIEKSLKGLPEGVLSDENIKLAEKVKVTIELVVSAYESYSYGKVQEILQFTLIPSFKKWKSELEKNFNQYLVL